MSESCKVVASVGKEHRHYGLSNKVRYHSALQLRCGLPSWVHVVEEEEMGTEASLAPTIKHAHNE